MGKEEHFASRKSASQIISLHKAKIRIICGGLERIKMATQAKDSPSPCPSCGLYKILGGMTSFPTEDLGST
jgi:hypothetical protein